MCLRCDQPDLTTGAAACRRGQDQLVRVGHDRSERTASTPRTTSPDV